MFTNHKLSKIFIILILTILSNCQLKKTTKTHGIVFLENRYNKLVINKTNINDVLKEIGQPHTRSVTNDKIWIYIERVLSKGSFHKMGSNVIVKNNVMVLNFDKYGVLSEKNFYDKKKLANIDFSNDVTQNNLSQKSFVQEFLQSIKSKMYGNK